jgi:opacity protein-like surface antigen
MRPIKFAMFAFAVLLAASAQAQTAGEDARIATALTGGISLGHETAGTVSGEAVVRLTGPIAFTVEAGHLWNVGTQDLDTRAQTIATALGATATAAYRVTFVDAGVRLRIPIASGARPYVGASVGVARVRTDTTFTANGSAASPSGVQLGSDLSGAVTKPTVGVSGGAMLAVGAHAFIDLGARYTRIFARTSQIPDDQGINVVRLQAGIGVRF